MQLDRHRQRERDRQTERESERDADAAPTGCRLHQAPPPCPLNWSSLARRRPPVRPRSCRPRRGVHTCLLVPSRETCQSLRDSYVCVCETCAKRAATKRGRKERRAPRREALNAAACRGAAGRHGFTRSTTSKQQRQRQGHTAKLNMHVPLSREIRSCTMA